MSISKRESKPITKKTADALAGTPVSNEMSVLGTENTAQPAMPRNRPTADDLAGIPISVEETEQKEPLQSRKKGQRR